MDNLIANNHANRFISLKDIVLKKRCADARLDNNAESYLMCENPEEQESENNKTFVVKRMNLIFNDKEC